MSYNSKYKSSKIEEILDSVGGKQDAIADLDAIRSGAEKGATALQSYTEKYTGTITGIKMNGASKGSSGVVDLGNVVTSVKINGSTKSPSSGVVDLGTVITSHQSLSNYYTKSEVDSKIASSITNAINASY
jgi:hypothetical protein